MSDRSINLTHFLLAAVFCVLVAVGSFFDLDISRELYMPLNIPFLVITIAGEYVFFGAFVFFAGVLARQAAVSAAISRRRRIVYIVICGYLALSTGTIGSKAVLHRECIGALFPDVDFSFLFAVIFCLLFMYPLFFAGYAAAPRKTDRELIRRMITMLIFITAVALTVGALKQVFARPRYRVTLAGYDGIEFTPWYMPIWNTWELMERHGVTFNSLRSLPSGHSAMAVSSIFIFPAFASVFPKLKGREHALFLAGLIYGLAVMLSRIVLGAHYLSDVSFGALLAVLFSYVFTRFGRKRQFRTNNSPDA